MSHQLTDSQTSIVDFLLHAAAMDCATGLETPHVKAQCLTDNWALVKASLMNVYDMDGDLLESYFNQYKSNLINDSSATLNYR